MIIISDFDGTISNIDLIDYILDTHYGPEMRQEHEEKVFAGDIKSDYFYDKLSDIKDIHFYIDKLKNSFNKVIDEYFRAFYDECIRMNYKFYIISSGFKQLIQYFLPYIDPTHIFANDLENLAASKIKKTEILQHIRNIHAREEIIYIGDGISDFEIADKVDILYALKNSNLETFCKAAQVNFSSFLNFSDIHYDLFKVFKQYKLLSPGIVRHDDITTQALSYQHTFMHRNQEFRDLNKLINDKLIRLVAAADCVTDYITLLVTGSGTTSMEEVISAHVNDNILILSNGLFGERWLNIAQIYNKTTVFCVKNKWGDIFDLESIEQNIKYNNIKTLLVVHCDTSVGILNNIDLLGQLCHKYNLTFIVDAVSTFGAIPISMDLQHIDFLITNPNKALASHMGLGIIIARHDKIKNINQNDCKTYSLNLARHYECAKNNETMNSVSISSINALLTTLNVNFADKHCIERNYKKCQELFNYMYDNIKYDKLLDKDISSPCIITILIYDSNNIMKYLKMNGFIVYECKGDLLNKGFQISFFGADSNLENIIKITQLINYYIPQPPTHPPTHPPLLI
jgi:aspartate aminotransferase-like enzyme/2-hydroxy-3-keto-5-methylthiopentenyl-1-phosphate phosphatase